MSELMNRPLPRAALPALAVLLALGAFGATAAAAQPAPRAEVFAYTFEHQPAEEALVLIRSLLSPAGTVELQAGGRAVVVRDTGEVVARVAEMLERFDHPPRAMRLDIHLLRAVAAGQGGGENVPEEVVRVLRQHLRYDHYAILGSVGLTSLEGQAVTYALGDDFDVSFRLGTVLAGQKLRLHDFRITRRPPRLTAANANKSRQPAPRELLHTHLNLWRDKQFALVLSQESAQDQALMVAITFRPEDQP